MPNAENLKGKQFKKGVSGNPKGRPKSVKGMLKDLPPDALEKVCQVLWTAIAMPNQKEAKKYLEDEAKGMPKELGFALQICIKELNGRNGFNALMAIINRIFGAPRQVAEVEHKGEGWNIIVRSDEDRKMVEGIKDLDI